MKRELKEFEKLVDKARQVTNSYNDVTREIIADKLEDLVNEHEELLSNDQIATAEELVFRLRERETSESIVEQSVETLERRLRPCANCGSPEFILAGEVIPVADVNTVTNWNGSDRYNTVSRRLTGIRVQLVVCSSCGVSFMMAEDLEAIRGTTLHAKTASVQGPYR